jgi:hypothetical protein
VAVRSAADEADKIAAEIGEHGDAADWSVGRGQNAAGSELLGSLWGASGTTASSPPDSVD